jgi:hypothetical protein
MMKRRAHPINVAAPSITMTQPRFIEAVWYMLVHPVFMGMPCHCSEPRNGEAVSESRFGMAIGAHGFVEPWRSFRQHGTGGSESARCQGLTCHAGSVTARVSEGAVRCGSVTHLMSQTRFCATVGEEDIDFCQGRS